MTGQGPNVNVLACRSCSMSDLFCSSGSCWFSHREKGSTPNVKARSTGRDVFWSDLTYPVRGAILGVEVKGGKRPNRVKFGLVGRVSPFVVLGVG